MRVWASPVACCSLPASTVALFALSGGSASMGASTGTVWKQTGWATIATPRPGVHVQRKQVWVTGYSGPRTITRVAWSIGSSHVSLDAMPLGTYRSGDAGFGGSRISALSGAGGFIAGINGDTFAGGWMCSYCHLHGLLVHDRWIRNFGVRGPEVGFGPSGSMVMGEATAAPVQFLLKGMAVTVGQFGALPSTGNDDQIGIYTSGSQTLPANTYGVVVDATVLSSLLRTSTPRSPMSLHGLGHKEPVQSFRLVEPEAAAVTQSLTIAGAYPAGSHVTLAAGQMLLVGRTGTGGPYAGNALEHTVAYHLPVRVTMSDSGWGTMDDVMDGKYQFVHNGLAQTGRPPGRTCGRGAAWASATVASAPRSAATATRAGSPSSASPTATAV